MTYDARERSTQDGRPIALYLLKWGNTIWRYTNAAKVQERQEMVNGVMATVTYLPVAISDSGMKQGTSQQNDFTVTIPSDLPIVGLFRGTPPSLSIWMTVRRRHVGDDEAPIYWKGLVFNVKRQGDAKADIIGKPMSATLRRTGLRLCWTRECPHFLYDEGCKVDPEDYRTAAVVETATGVTITLTGAPDKDDQYFRGGYVEWEANADGTVERRMIEDHQGDTLKVFGLAEVDAGTPVGLFPGCNRTPGDCVDKFDNGPNYGGVDFMPGVSPFDAPVW